MDGVLNRRWEDVPGGGVCKHLQLVLPGNLVKSVLVQVAGAYKPHHLVHPPIYDSRPHPSIQGTCIVPWWVVTWGQQKH